MNIADLFQTLSYGELSNLAVSGTGSGTIITAAKPKIINFANEALLRLHTRFLLKEREVTVELVSWITNYNLDREYAESNTDSTQDILYIKDTPRDPFTNDVIKVLGARGPHGEKYPLNDVESPWSIFSPRPTLVQVPQPIPGFPLDILYQARHVPLDYTTLTQNIDLPNVLEGALLSYISYKVFSAMNSDGSNAKAQELMAMYSSICNEIVEFDSVNNGISETNVKFQKGGFV